MVGLVNGPLFGTRSPADEIASAAPPNPLPFGRRVAAPAWPIEFDRDGGIGLHVDCARCGNWAEVHGTGKASYDAACCRLRATCPRGESNFYAEP